MENFYILFFLISGNVFQFYLILSMIIYLFISVTGIFVYRFKDKKTSYSTKFALLIPAHNEEKVIGNLIESLRMIDYPSNMYDVYIICDHSLDLTEKIAGESGFEVLHYSDNLPSSKARALNLATDDIMSIDKKMYDAFCYFDADSLVHPDFLKVMSYYIENGELAIQGRQIPKNPNESLLSMIVSSSQYITNYFFQKPKEYLGLSATLHGKGMCFAAEVVKRFKWDENCLTEDLEMQMRLINNSIKIRWAEDAIVYDEEPVHINQYIKRSIRWTKGSLDTAKKHAFNLLTSFVKTLDFKRLEAFIYCFGVYRVLVVFFVGVSIYITKGNFNMLVYIFKNIPYDNILLKFMFLSLPFIIFPASMIFDKMAGFKMFLVYFLQPVLGFFRIPIFLLGIFKDRSIWDKTEHTSAVRISDVLRMKI